MVKDYWSSVELPHSRSFSFIQVLSQKCILLLWWSDFSSSFQLFLTIKGYSERKCNVLGPLINKSVMWIKEVESRHYHTQNSTILSRGLFNFGFSCTVHTTWYYALLRRCFASISQLLRVIKRCYAVNMQSRAITRYITRCYLLAER